MESTDQTQLKTAPSSSGATFRICGTGLNLEAITRDLDLAPSYTHQQGEPDVRGHVFPHDMWSLTAPVGADEPLEFHVGWLAKNLLPRKEKILALKQTAKVDIYCQKVVTTEQIGLALSSLVLELFVELEINLDVSLIFLPDGNPG